MIRSAKQQAGISTVDIHPGIPAPAWPGLDAINQRLDAVNEGGRLEWAARAIELVGHALTAGDAARQSGALAVLLSNAARDVREAAARFDDVVEVLGELALA